jgi:hypothetical protein
MNDDLELRRALRALDRERNPGRDLWPDIAATIQAGTLRQAPAHPVRSSTRRHLLPLAMAASALLAAVVLWPSVLDAPQPTVAEVNRAEREAAPVAGLGEAHGERMLRQVDALSIEFRVALAQLEGPLPPALRPAARDLRDSELALRDALREQPQSRFLLDQLRRTYEQQLRLSQLAALG